MAQSEISLRQNSSGSKNFVTVAYFCDKATEKHRVFTALSLFFKLPAEYAVPFPCVSFRVVGLVKDTLTLSDLLYFSICFVNRRFFTFFLANLFAVAILSDTLCFVRAGYLPRYRRIPYTENCFLQIRQVKRRFCVFCGKKFLRRRLVLTIILQVGIILL